MHPHREFVLFEEGQHLHEWMAYEVVKHPHVSIPTHAPTLESTRFDRH
jgi:hypothetical protein